MALKVTPAGAFAGAHDDSRNASQTMGFFTNNWRREKPAVSPDGPVTGSTRGKTSTSRNWHEPCSLEEAATAAAQRQETTPMPSPRQNLFMRDDTFFGVCEGLGEDLGVPSNLLRAALALLLFWNPVVVAGVYAAAGILVLALRLLFPNPRPAAAAVDQRDVAPAVAHAIENGDRQLPELQAAA